MFMLFVSILRLLLFLLIRLLLLNFVLVRVLFLNSIVVYIVKFYADCYSISSLFYCCFYLAFKVLIVYIGPVWNSLFLSLFKKACANK
jgi:hypothetical protein